MEPYNLVSVAGIFALVAIAYLFSKDRSHVNWQLIIWGLAFQLIVALFVFVFPFGTKVFLGINRLVVEVLNSATAGVRFLFGRLALPPGTTNESGEGSLGFILAFQGLPSVIFFASLMGVLYYLGIMPLLVRGFASVFTRFMKISGAESLCAASNIFVGVESFLTVKPHLENMTKSELCTILAAGMGTIASSMLALYVSVLRVQFPTIAGHLISASLLSAPAAVIMAKTLFPETESPKTLGVKIQAFYEKENNLFEAIINGAAAGVKLVVGIVSLLLALLGLVALIDLALGGVGNSLNSLLRVEVDWTIRGLLGYLFLPLAFVIGVPWADAQSIAAIIGERAVLTEVVAYQDLARLLEAGGLVNARSAVITVYALCGFAHVASLAIFVGGAAALAPTRIKDLSSVGLRAFLAATLGCLLTASWAGAFFNKGSILLGK